MRPIRSLCLSLCAVGWISACQSLTPVVTPPVHPPLTMCHAPRPELCTQQYDPVCGYGADHRQLGTFGNGCSACGHTEVMGYTQGDCAGKTHSSQ